MPGTNREKFAESNHDVKLLYSLRMAILGRRARNPYCLWRVAYYILKGRIWHCLIQAGVCSEQYYLLFTVSLFTNLYISFQAEFRIRELFNQILCYNSQRIKTLFVPHS